MNIRNVVLTAKRSQHRFWWIGGFGGWCIMIGQIACQSNSLRRVNWLLVCFGCCLAVLRWGSHTAQLFMGVTTAF